MRIYFDICCPKRPFDDQSQGRVAMETAAIVAVLDQCDQGLLTPIRSGAHDVENDLDPDVRRATAVREWLQQLPEAAAGGTAVADRFAKFRAEGIGSMIRCILRGRFN